MLKTSLLLLCLIILFGNQTLAQRKLSFDKIPIDTSRWRATDSLFMKLNEDGIDDLVLVFNKYKGLFRPNNIQVPILVFLAKRKNEFVFFKNAEKSICLPDFKISILPKGFQILQKGIKDDRNWYTVYYRYEGNDIKVYKEVVEENIVKIKTDSKTGVLTESRETNKIYTKDKSVSISNYSCQDLISKFKN